MLVDVTIHQEQAIIRASENNGSYRAGQALLVVPSKYVSCRMPGETNATFEADVSDEEVDLQERVPASRRRHG